MPVAVRAGPMVPDRHVPIQDHLPAMIGYAVAVAAYVNLPESVAGAGAQGVLRRLRGTPLPFRWYLAGRVPDNTTTARTGPSALSARRKAVRCCRLRQAIA
jgi:hypothetical protein